MNKKLRALKLFLLIFTFTIPSVSAFCLFGIGNTCGGDATTEHTFLGPYFNFDEPRANSEICFFGGCNTGSRFSSPSSNKVSESEGGTTDIIDDKGNSYEIKTVKRTTRKVTSSSGELAPALFYDVNILNSEFTCINCPIVNGVEIRSAGFTYNLDLDLINDGNIETEQPIGLEIMIDTPEGVQEIIFNRNSLIFPPGTYELSIPIESFGTEAGRLKDFYILRSGDLRDIPINVEVRVFDDYGVPEPRIQQITKTDRVCSGVGDSRSCDTKVSYEEKESCPDGSSYGGLFSCINPNGEKGNELLRTYNIQRVSPDVLGSSQFSFFRG